MRGLSLILVLSLLLLNSSGRADAHMRPDALASGPTSASGRGKVNSVTASSGWDWPQVQRDPQRTGYTPEVLGTDFQVAWSHAFSPEKIFPQVQAIVYGGLVFVGTEMGNLYALDALTGDQVWVHHVGAPILNSVAAAEGKVFFGAMDGAVYALDVESGGLAWKADLLWRHGFSTAPVLAENKILLGSRNGVFYALDPSTGETVWEYDVGAPILQTAAWNDGRAFFGGMDMRVYAVNTADGTLSWRSERLTGMAFKDYWPVVHQGKVLVRAMNGDPTYRLDNFYALDEDTGSRTVELPQFNGKTMNGATSPPAVDREGFLVVPVSKPGDYGSCWGRLDLSTQEVVDILAPTDSGSCGNNDENESVSCAQNLVIGVQVGGTSDGNVGAHGAFDLDHRVWTDLVSGVDHQPNHNTQGGGVDPASISNGMFYHIPRHTLIAWTTRP